MNPCVQDRPRESYTPERRILTWSFESGNLKSCKMGEELTKKKRIRAGHRALVTRIIAQVLQALEYKELNSSKLKQQLQTLREKVDVLRKLDSYILSALETEEDISGDIEQADIVKETLESTIFDLEAALTTQEQNNLPTVQLTLRNPSQSNCYLPPER